MFRATVASASPDLLDQPHVLILPGCARYADGEHVRTKRQIALPPTSELLYALWLPLIGLVATGVGLGSHQNGQKGKRKTAARACALLAGLSFQLACGGSNGTPSGSYTITVNGTAFIPVNYAVTSATLTVQ